MATLNPPLLSKQNENFRTLAHKATPETTEILPSPGLLLPDFQTLLAYFSDPAVNVCLPGLLTGDTDILFNDNLARGFFKLIHPYDIQAFQGLRHNARILWRGFHVSVDYEI